MATTRIIPTLARLTHTRAGGRADPSNGLFLCCRPDIDCLERPRRVAAPRPPLRAAPASLRPAPGSRLPAHCSLLPARAAVLATQEMRCGEERGRYRFVRYDYTALLCWVATLATTDGDGPNTRCQCWNSFILVLV